MHSNLKAYDSYEQNFLNEFEEDVFRLEKIKFALETHVPFIKKLFDKKINVLELGSGNSKTLFALASEGINILEKGYGIEVSKSRFSFAEYWKKEWEFDNVQNINSDFVNFDFNTIDNFDLCFCVDLAFQFIEPIDKESPVRILKTVHDKLNDCGKIILELDGCKRVIDEKTGNKKIWEEFKEPDPWRYSLWDCSYDKEQKFLIWRKTFLKRNSNEIDETNIVLRIYNKSEIQELLEKSGFKNVQFYSSDWKGSKFENDELEFVVVADK